MFGLDELIAALGSGGSLLVVVGVAVLLGLRHATDPDHLVAVTTLLATEPERPVRRASGLGLSWGLGHATTLIALGVPVVLVQSSIPAAVHVAAETLVGLVIMALALRLLIRWRRGGFHAHEHSHGGSTHRHLHGHDREHLGAHEHDHRPALARSSVQAYGIGLVHGVGGSAAVSVLLLASIESSGEAILALAVFAAATAASMAILSLCLGQALVKEPVKRRFEPVAPALGALSLAFGAWYAAGALQSVF